MAETLELLDRPAESLTGVVLWATVLFYWAEKDENDKVLDVWDAFHYVTTSLSVGYANIFPVTPLGKVIGGLVMCVGPSLSAHALDPAGGERDKLDEILAELKKISTALSAS